MRVITPTTGISRIVGSERGNGLRGEGKVVEEEARCFNVGCDELDGRESANNQASDGGIVQI